MKLKYLIFLTAILSGLNERSWSQVYNSPSTGLFTPETMEVIKADVSHQATKLFLAVENRINGGTFCAYRNIIIVLPDGSRLRMQKSEGIPQCPDAYRFKSIGEKLSFTLIFPALKSEVKWIDVIEDCSENCFRIYGIVLDNELTARINKAISLVENKQPDSAIEAYKEIIAGLDKAHAGLGGSLYSDLIALLTGKGYSAQASEWYKKLQASSFPHKELYINNLNSRGIKF